jgi:hypothetical protein
MVSRESESTNHSDNFAGIAAGCKRIPLSAGLRHECALSVAHEFHFPTASALVVSHFQHPQLKSVKRTLDIPLSLI